MHCNGGTPLRTPTVTKTKTLFNHLMTCIIRRWRVSGKIESEDTFCDTFDAFILDKERNVDIYTQISFLSLCISIFKTKYIVLVSSRKCLFIYSRLHKLEYVDNTFLGNVLIRDPKKGTSQFRCWIFAFMYPRTSTSFRNKQFLVTRAIMSRQT